MWELLLRCLMTTNFRFLFLSFLAILVMAFFILQAARFERLLLCKTLIQYPWFRWVETNIWWLWPRIQFKVQCAWSTQIWFETLIFWMVVMVLLRVELLRVYLCRGHWILGREYLVLLAIRLSNLHELWFLRNYTEYQLLVNITQCSIWIERFL